MPDERADSVDVDTRFLLANERTLLAWVRTALALMAAGGAVSQAATRFAGRRPLALVLVALGIFAAWAGARRHRQADVAIRSGRLPVRSAEPYLLTGAIVAVGVAVAIAVALRA